MNMRNFLSIAKALADSNRVRALMFLRRGELCLCQIIEILGLAPSTVSKHMANLYQAGLVETRKEGRWIYYRLPESGSVAVRGALRWLTDTLANEKQIRNDDKAVRAVRKAPKEDLCCHYK